MEQAEGRPATPLDRRSARQTSHSTAKAGVKGFRETVRSPQHEEKNT